MSFRDLVAPDCGGQNPLMQLGNQMTKDFAYKDEGFTQAPIGTRPGREHLEENQLVNEFLSQAAPPPKSFQMDNLLREMRAIDVVYRDAVSPRAAPSIMDALRQEEEVWIKQFDAKNEKKWVEPFAPFRKDERETVSGFFDKNGEQCTYPGDPFGRWFPPVYAQQNNYDLLKMPYDNNYGLAQPIDCGLSNLKWEEDFEKQKEESAEEVRRNNDEYWKHLQDQWEKMAEEIDDEGHPWLKEFSNAYEDFRVKEYAFTEENPMKDIEDPLQKGKEFYANGDIPSAVLCFEAAAQKDPQSVEAWELLGISQAENEMDPQAIAALKKSLELDPMNAKVLMALAVSYTNESLQNQALKMLISWLNLHPKYKHLVPGEMLNYNASALTATLTRSPEMKEIQNIFLEAVKMNPKEIDPDIQEALGILFTLSSEYDKAVDCFQAALQIRPDNAKVWNRLGASLANGNRSVEAVEAYQRALEIEPGFIRARYNVGITCMNLKAYKESAEHLLTALNLQATSSARSGLLQKSNDVSQMSDTIWSTLRMVVSLMGRKELHDMLDAKDLDKLNEAFNIA